MEWKNQFCSRDGSTGSKFLCISILTALASFTNATYIDVFERNQPYAPESSPPFRSQGAHHQRSHVVHARSRRSSYLLSANPTKEEVPRKPFFDNPGIKRNVTTTIGQTAYLHCHVAQLGNKAQVSWIRKRDLHVLSSGVVVFASDQRFQVLHPAESEKWTLQIKYAQSRDAGIYECQVNTEPKISRSYFLSVIESRARIMGPEYVKAGSTINLTCAVNQPHMQSLIYWYHNREILDYEGSVSISTRGEGDRTTSHLTITRATTHHSGNYTCWPTSAQATSAIVNVVVEGEKPQAMQTGGVRSTHSQGFGAFVLQGTLLIIVLQVAFQLIKDPVMQR